MVWDGKTLAQNDDWIIHLDEGELAEIRMAIDKDRSSAKPISDLTRRDSDFGSFGQKLLAMRDDVLDGKGFAVLRGLPGNQWGDEDLIRAYWGIGTWLGDPVSQNAKAHLLGHVIDQRSNRSDDTRIYQTNRAQPFHSDSCDIVGLLCLRTAKSGGASAIASSSAIHKFLLDTDLNILNSLYGSFQCDRFGEIPAGKLPYYGVNVFNEIDRKFVCCGMDPDIRSAQRLDGVKALSRDQIRALEAFQAAAKKLALDMTLRCYLVRLWLSSPLGRTLPEFIVASEFSLISVERCQCYHPDRAGIGQYNRIGEGHVGQTYRK